LQALVRKKEEKRKREREEKERKDREEKEKRERVMIEKESTKKSFSEVELDIDSIFPSITEPCEDVLEEKYVSRSEPDIEINYSCTKKTYASFIENE